MTNLIEYNITYCKETRPDDFTKNIHSYYYITKCDRRDMKIIKINCILLLKNNNNNE